MKKQNECIFSAQEQRSDHMEKRAEDSRLLSTTAPQHREHDPLQMNPFIFNDQSDAAEPQFEVSYPPSPSVSAGSCSSS